MIDKPYTSTQRDDPKNDESRFDSGIAPSKARRYSKRVMGLLVAATGIGLLVWRNTWGFLDKHSGAISTLATVMIMVLTIYYVRYAKRQWQAMDNQLDQMRQQLPELRRSAKAAEDSANLTRQQVISSQAAIIGVHFDILYRFIPDEAHGLRFIVDYPSGSSLATVIHASIDASWKDARDLRDIGNIEHIEFDIPYMRSGKSIVKMVPLAGLNENTWETIEKKIGHRTIGVKGTLRYNNGFEQVPDQPFCFIWFAHPPVLGNSAQGFIECERYASVASMFAAFDKKAAEPPK